MAKATGRCNVTPARLSHINFLPPGQGAQVFNSNVRPSFTKVNATAALVSNSEVASAGFSSQACSNGPAGPLQCSLAGGATFHLDKYRSRQISFGRATGGKKCRTHETLPARLRSTVSSCGQVFGGLVALTSGNAFRPEAGEVAYHLGLLQAKIEQIAERAGLSVYERLTLEGLLAALPWAERRRVSLFLKAARAQSDDEALHQAIEILSALASRAWTDEPDAHVEARAQSEGAKGAKSAGQAANDQENRDRQR
jgi:hypothetical protein